MNKVLVYCEYAYLQYKIICLSIQNIQNWSVSRNF